MTADLFAERLAQIRIRFAAKLPEKIDAVDVVLPRLAGEGAAVTEALAVAHRSIHELCGIGPTVGFAETGRQARCVEQLLLQPLRAKRGLTETEIVGVRQGLHALRDAARSELQSMESKGE